MSTLLRNNDSSDSFHVTASSWHGRNIRHFPAKKCYNEFRIFDFSLRNTFYRIRITTDLSCLPFSSNIRAGPSPSNNNFPVIPDAQAFMIRSEPNDPGGGGYSTDVRVGRCGWDT